MSLSVVCCHSLCLARIYFIFVEKFYFPLIAIFKMRAVFARPVVSINLVRNNNRTIFLCASTYVDPESLGIRGF